MYSPFEHCVRIDLFDDAIAEAKGGVIPCLTQIWDGQILGVLTCRGAEFEDQRLKTDVAELCRLVQRRYFVRLATVFGPLRQFNLAHPLGLGLRSGFCF
jgi:hypothetical protein